MQHINDDLAAALGIVGALGCVSACLYSFYHSVMMAVCYHRDTTPDQRAHTPLTYRDRYRCLSDTGKLHVLKGVLGLMASLGFFLLLVGASKLLAN